MKPKKDGTYPSKLALSINIQQYPHTFFGMLYIYV